MSKVRVELTRSQAEAAEYALRLYVSYPSELATRRELAVFERARLAFVEALASGLPSATLDALRQDRLR